MEKWLLLVESSCTDLSREQDFKDWYNNIHIPDMLELSSVTRSTRYEIREPVDNEGKYLAIYEIESENFNETMDQIATHLKEKSEQGRISDLLRVTRRVRAKKIFSKPK
jgi:hypothetical protein